MTEHRNNQLSLILAALLVGFQVGCMSWQGVVGAPGPAISDTRLGEVRVTFLDGTRRVVWSPELQNDTLIGYGAPTRAGESTRDIAVPMSAVKEVAVYRKNLRRTRTLAVGGGVATLGVLSFVAARAVIHALGEIEIEIESPFDSCFLDLSFGC